MKKGWLIVLLLSVGLNLGLGYRLWRGSGPQTDTEVTGPRGGCPPHFIHDRRDSLWQRGMMDRRLRRMAMALDLRPDQAAAMRRVQQENGELIRRQEREVAGLRHRLRGLLTDPATDSLVVRDLMHEMGRRQAGLDSLVTETIMREMEILDPPQRQAYLRMLPLGRSRFAGPGGGPGLRRGQ